jgi:Arc/MetJ-type ribon-helix-helix transcriptional regulator
MCLTPTLGLSYGLMEKDEMNVKLPPDLEGFVTRKLESGVCGSVEDVIQEGLLLLQARDEFNEQKVAEKGNRNWAGTAWPGQS